MRIRANNITTAARDQLLGSFDIVINQASQGGDTIAKRTEIRSPAAISVSTVLLFEYTCSLAVVLNPAATGTTTVRIVINKNGTSASGNIIAVGTSSDTAFSTWAMRRIA
jgi:hypothetical protein